MNLSYAGTDLAASTNPCDQSRLHQPPRRNGNSTTTRHGDALARSDHVDHRQKIVVVGTMKQMRTIENGLPNRGAFDPEATFILPRTMTVHQPIAERRLDNPPSHETIHSYFRRSLPSRRVTLVLPSFLPARAFNFTGFFSGSGTTFGGGGASIFWTRLR